MGGEVAPAGARRAARRLPGGPAAPDRRDKVARAGQTAPAGFVLRAGACLLRPRAAGRAPLNRRRAA